MVEVVWAWMGRALGAIITSTAINTNIRIVIFIVSPFAFSGCT
jgi:hypothetical protein